MKLLVLTHEDEEGWVVAEVPALPGCMTQGRTRSEALENIKDAIAGWLQAERRDGDPNFAPPHFDLTELEVEAA